VSNLNGDVLDQTKAIIVINELPLVNAEGEPVKDKKTGQPIVKKLTECDKLDGTYAETCRELFITASNCKIDPPEDGNIDACVTDKVASWVDSYMTEDTP
jgi:hypothetical protein